MKTKFKPIEIGSMLFCKDISIAIRIALDHDNRYWKNCEASRTRLQNIHKKLMLHMAGQLDEYNSTPQN